MSTDCEKIILKHEKSCKKDIDDKMESIRSVLDKKIDTVNQEHIDQRHILGNKTQGLVTWLDKKIDKNREEITKIEISNSAYNETIKSMQKDIKKIDEKVDWLVLTINDFIKTADEKYAGKNSFNMLVKFVVTIATAVVFWWWAFIWKLITDNIIWK